MRHQPNDRRDLNGRNPRQATWSSVAIVMLAGSSMALGQSGSQSSPPVNTGLTNLPSVPPVPTQAQNGASSSSRNPQTSQASVGGQAAGDAAIGIGQGAQPAGEPGNVPAPADVKVDDNLIVDLHLNNEDLSKVLEMLSIQSQRNIVASGGISNAKVSANLYGVTFYEALDAILHPNGYGYIDRGNMIYVHTIEELKQIEQASRVRVSKVVTLNYLNAIDAAEFVKPLLSEGGSIKTPGKTKDFSIPGGTPVGADEYALDATLVVYDYDENVAEIEKLLKGLDTKPAQVLVEATIVQTALTENNAFGVDFSLIADMNFADFSGVGGPLKAVDSMISAKGGQLTGGSSIPIQVPADNKGGAVVSSPGNTSGPGTLKIGLVDKSVAVFLKMLDEVSDTTILSNPKILALNRQPARVLVGRKVGYLSTTSTDTTTTQTVEFLDTGTQLYFRPFVSLNDSRIRMELKPQVSEAVIREAKDATGAAVTIPDENTNELVTNVIVKDGQTIVLGGLFRESTQSSRSQVPFLGDIPLIGSAFRGHEDNVQRSEIIFLITPSIVKDELLAKQGKIAENYVDHARTGAREGLLPWSRDKMTGMKLIEAQKLAAAGDTEKARWKLQQSLALNHNQPDAIGMLKQLGGDVNTWSSRSLLNAIVNDEVKLELKTSKLEYDPEHWPTPENTGGTNAGGIGNGNTNDSSSVTFTPSDVRGVQPTNASPTEPNPNDIESGFNPSSEPTSQPTPSPNSTEPVFNDEVRPETQPGFDPQNQPASEPAFDPSTAPSNEFVPPTPNSDSTTPSDTTPPVTPENSVTDPSATTPTANDASYDSGSFAGSTTPDATASPASGETGTAAPSATKSGDTAVAGTKAERQAEPSQTIPDPSGRTNAGESTPSGNSVTPTATSPSSATTTNSTTGADHAAAASVNGASGSSNSGSVTPTTQSPSGTDTTTSKSHSQAPTSDSTNVTPSNTTSTPAPSTPAPSGVDSAANNTNTTDAATSNSAENPSQAFDQASQPNSGFEASEASAAGVVHGEKSNLDLLSNAIRSQAGDDQAETQQNAENSTKSANPSSQNADNNTASGSSSGAPTSSNASATGKTGKSSSVKEVKPSKSAATGKTTTPATKAAKPNTKDAKAAKVHAAQEAKKKKSSWGIFDFLRPSDDDEKAVTTDSKGQETTGPPSNPK